MSEIATGSKDVLKSPFLKNIISGALRESQDVLFAYLFGSCVAGAVTKSSDIDIAVYLEKKRPDLDDQLSLHLKLSRALGTDKIDLLIINNTRNIILLDSIVRHGIVIHDRDRERRESFELHVLHSAIDFKEQRRLLIGR
jgi:predicted nucleotidyltransferase